MTIRVRLKQPYPLFLVDLVAPAKTPDNPKCRHAWHLYILRLNLDTLSVDRNEFIEELRKRQIGTSVHFIPIQLHPYFARLPLARRPCARALELYPRIVSLPLYPAMTEEQVDYVARMVQEVLVQARREKYIAAGSSMPSYQ